MAIIAHSGGDFCQSIHDFLPFNHIAENNVAGWQRVVLVHNEKLAPIRVTPGIGHGDNPAPIAPLVKGRAPLNLVLEGSSPSTFSTGPISLRVASLDHESLDNAVKGQPIVIAMLGQQTKILYSLGGFLFKQLNFYGTLFGFNKGVAPA